MKNGIFSQYLQIAINLAVHCVKIDLLNVIWTILNEFEFFIQQKWMKMNSKKSTVLWAVSNEFQKCWKKIFGQKWSFLIMVRTHVDFNTTFKCNSRVSIWNILLNNKVINYLLCWRFLVTSILVTYVWDEISWGWLQDVDDDFVHFGQHDPLQSRVILIWTFPGWNSAKQKVIHANRYSRTLYFLTWASDINIH